ncbi:unnamed protein product, partial [Prorocentrum cordatum]
LRGHARDLLHAVPAGARGARRPPGAPGEAEAARQGRCLRGAGQAAGAGAAARHRAAGRRRPGR